MKSLIVEDNYITSEVMKEILKQYGPCDVAVNGVKAVELFKSSINSGQMYDIIFLDIMMPEMDGQQVLQEVRKIETEFGYEGLDSVKIVMTTALDDIDNIFKSFKEQCDGYLVKPLDKKTVEKKLNELHLL